MIMMILSCQRKLSKTFTCNYVRSSAKTYIYIVDIRLVIEESELKRSEHVKSRNEYGCPESNKPM